MNAEKYFDKAYPDFNHEDFADEWVQKRDDWKKDMVEFAEAYASHERERMLNMSDDDIYKIIGQKKTTHNREIAIMFLGAKMMLNHFK